MSDTLETSTLNSNALVFFPVWASDLSMSPATQEGYPFSSVVLQRFNAVFIHENFLDAYEEPDL